MLPAIDSPRSVVGEVHGKGGGAPCELLQERADLKNLRCCHFREPLRPSPYPRSGFCVACINRASFGSRCRVVQVLCALVFMLMDVCVVTGVLWIPPLEF
jgi:hypothetical protein